MFASCELGDRRRSERAVRIAQGIALRTSASIPMQAQSGKDAKAAYRFFDTDAVTFEKLSEPHWLLTREAFASHRRVLVLQDTTAVSFSGRVEIEGLGPIGTREISKGLWLHSALVVSDETEPSVLGLAYQEIWARQSAPEDETENQRHKRPRESERWARTVRESGVATGCRVLHVCDRESDIFEVYEACRETRAGYVVRVRTNGSERLVHDGHDADAAETPLTELIRQTPACAEKKLELRARPGKPARTADLRVSVRPVAIPPPRIRDRRRTKGIEPIKAWVVRVWEPKPPKGVEALEWVLVTSEPTSTPEEALNVTRWYAARWLIEEYHKCLKTGCAVEERQLEHADRLKPLTAMLGIVAVRLLQMKLAGRRTPDRPAAEIVPKIYTRVLAAYRNERKKDYTCRQFWRAVAQLGGFMGRKGDGDPGWITLWRGWQQLEMLILGAELAKELTEES